MVTCRKYAAGVAIGICEHFEDDFSQSPRVATADMIATIPSFRTRRRVSPYPVT